MGLHKVGVCPVLLNTEAPALLVADLDLRRFVHVQGVRIGGRAVCRLAPVSLDAGVAVTQPQSVAPGDLVVPLLHHVPGADHQAAHLDGVVRGDLGDRAVHGSGEGCVMDIFRALQVCKVPDAQRPEALRRVVPDTVVSVPVLDVVGVHVGGGQAPGLLILIAQVESEAEEGLILLLTVLCVKMQPLCAVHIVEELGDVQGPHGALADAIVVIDLRTLLHAGLRNSVVHPAGVIRGRSFQCHAVGLHPVVDLRIDPALHDIVLRGVVRQVDHRALARLEHEDMLIFLRAASGLEFLHVGNRRDAVPVGHEVRVAFFFSQEMVLCLSVRLLPVVDLVGELDQAVGFALGARQLLAQDDGPGLDGGQVEAHVEVGGAGTALHVEHGHRMICIILEDSAAFVKILRQIVRHLCCGCVRISRPVIALKYFADCIRIRALCACCCLQCDLAAADDLARAEIDRSCHGRAHPAQVQDKFSVYIQPEIIISGKFEDNVVSPGIQAACRLRETRLHLHPEEVIRIF